MGISQYFDTEGEMALYLHVNGEVVYLLVGVHNCSGAVGSIFSKRSGADFAIPGDEGLVPGHPSRHQIAPATLRRHRCFWPLLAGRLRALGIRRCGPGDSRPPIFERNPWASSNRPITICFSALVFFPPEPSFFRAPLRLEGEPLSSVKKEHKLRTKQKRAFKRSFQCGLRYFLPERIPRSNTSAPSGSNRRLPQPCSQLSRFRRKMN